MNISYEEKYFLAEIFLSAFVVACQAKESRIANCFSMECQFLFSKEIFI